MTALRRLSEAGGVLLRAAVRFWNRAINLCALVDEAEGERIRQLLFSSTELVALRHQVSQASGGAGDQPTEKRPRRLAPAPADYGSGRPAYSYALIRMSYEAPLRTAVLVSFPGMLLWAVGRAVGRHWWG